ncbi:MAG: dephospho-CoA kinase [Oscillospiraceae bacterium]|nr:dephospho-CoA kinase [Oscillospiraceae bacterium]
MSLINSLYVVGLTGPTGSGKSEVARVFTNFNIPVIDADEIARKVVEPGSKCLKKLVDAFSDEILQTDGTLNRRELAKRAFATPEKTQLLNSITHPYIIELIKIIIIRMEQTHEKIAVLDAPLLFESGLDSICNKTVAVLAPYQIRLERILLRDNNLTEQEARARMSTQKPEEYYTARASTVLYNDGDFETLQKKARKLALDIQEWANEK